MAQTSEIFQTVDLSDLYVTSGINVNLMRVSYDSIEDGDTIRYTDDNGNIRIGTYVTLWAYEHAGETSPFWGDNRVMAFVLVDGGSDYADIEIIEKLVDATPTMCI